MGRGARGSESDGETYERGACADGHMVSGEALRDDEVKEVGDAADERDVRHEGDPLECNLREHIAHRAVAEPNEAAVDHGSPFRCS